MRKKEKEIKDEKKILEILDTCDVCRIAMNDEEGIYLVPMNFGYTFIGGSLNLYFHGAVKGRRFECLSKTEKVPVAFEMDCGHKLIPEENDFKYKSIIGEGMASIIYGNKEKLEAANIFMECTLGMIKEIPKKALDKTLFFKIEADKFSAKEN